MSKQTHLQGVAEQITKKGHGNAPFHKEKAYVQTGKTVESQDVHTKMLVDDVDIQKLAYQIFQEKGGSDLDNWFEAEGALNHNF